MSLFGGVKGGGKLGHVGGSIVGLRRPETVPSTAKAAARVAPTFDRVFGALAGFPRYSGAEAKRYHQPKECNTSVIIDYIEDAIASPITVSSAQPRVDSGRGQNRTLRPLSALWPPVFAGEQDVGPPKG